MAEDEDPKRARNVMERGKDMSNLCTRNGVTGEFVGG